MDLKPRTSSIQGRKMNLFLTYLFAASCGLHVKSFTVRGDSMSPLLKSAQEIRVSLDYYKCHRPVVGDIVIIKITDDRNEIVKKVVGGPGDFFEYRNRNIYINKKLLKNSQGQAYALDSKMLELYAKSYPTLPKDTYLVMGDNISGTLDSSKFGMIDIRQITGKVLFKSPQN